MEKKMSGKRNGEGGKRWKSRAGTGRWPLDSSFSAQSGGAFPPDGGSPSWAGGPGLGGDF